MKYKFSFLLFLFLLGCSNGSNNSSEENLRRHVDVDKFRIIEYVQKSTGSLSELSDFEKALTLRNFIHWGITGNGDVRPSVRENDPFDNLFRSFEDPTYFHFCGGFSWTFQDVLYSFGIESRLIQLIASYGPTHVSVEILVDDKWVAIDPTFNITLFNGADRVGYEDLNANTSLSWDNYDYRPELDVTNYPYPYHDHASEMWFYKPYNGQTQNIEFKVFQ